METPITLAAAISRSDAPPLLPRARGAVTLGVKPGAAGRSALAELRQAGSLKCLFPRRDGRALEAVLVNTAGGITGGDRFEIAARVAPRSALTLTTQAAERAYGTTAGETGRLTTRLDVSTDARLNWIPQETLLFDRSALARRLVVTLEPGATALLCEPLVFGRLAMGEELRAARFDDRIELRRAGQPLYLDATRLDGDIAAHLDRPHVAGGARAVATLIYVAPDAAAHLARIRACLPETAGASLIGDDVLALRLLAADSFALRQTLVPVLKRLTGADLPKAWMI